MTSETTAAPTRPTLRRPRSVVIGGVCSGLATHLGWSVRRTRILTIVLAFAGGAGALLYLWLWALVPLEQPADDEDAAVRRSAPVAVLLVILTGLSALAVLAHLPDGRELGISGALVATAVFGGAAVAWSLAFDRPDPTRSIRYGIACRAIASALMLLGGATALINRPNAVNAVLGVGVVVLAIVVLIAPRVVALWTALNEERATRVREEQRAEIAAHLHDSVLQTLALIQNRAGASSDVARIARAQERELRDWLFERDIPVADDLAAELRSIAAAIEIDYPARIEVVATGDSVRGIPAMVAASREAMLNAARHAGGEVSVYVETSPRAIDVFIRDRGPGVDLDALAHDRLGIRESIIGRMSRAGGSATVKPGGGGTGTEVHLHWETP